MFLLFISRDHPLAYIYFLNIVMKLHCTCFACWVGGIGRPPLRLALSFGRLIMFTVKLSFILHKLRQKQNVDCHSTI